MEKKLLFIFNPRAGKGQIKSCLSEILDIFTKAGYDVTVRPTQAHRDAYEYIKLHGGEYDRIVVSGGDGTLNESVKGLMTFEKDHRCPLGYIPAGTTNDFASTLDIPKSMTQAAKIAAQGALFPCDIGKFNDVTFNYVAAFGMFTDVSYDTPQEVKKALGHMAYIFEGIKKFSSLPSYHVKITYDDCFLEEDVFLCIVLNSTSVAGMRSPAKLMDVDLNDGMFELLMFKQPASLTDFQSVFIGLMKGETSGDGYLLLKSSRFEFESEENIKWSLDGEYGGDPKNAVIRVLPSAITYVVDPEAVILK